MSEASERPESIGRHAILLGALTGFLLLIPLVEPGTRGDTILSVATTVVLLSSLYVCARRRWVLVVGAALVLPALGAEWAEALGLGERLGPFARPLLLAGFFVFTAAVVLKAVLTERRVTLDTVFGGVAVYVLIGVGFAMVHTLVETLAPGSYRIAGGGGLVSDAPITAIYFSFTTLTTLGYGDIAPATRGARMLCVTEAAFGQLYVAVLIARVVSLEVSGAGTGARNKIG